MEAASPLKVLWRWSEACRWRYDRRSICYAYAYRRL